MSTNQQSAIDTLEKRIWAAVNAQSSMGNATDKSLESWIWDAACSIRGAKDAPKFKDYLLPLNFTKRLCDVFDDELKRIAKEVGSRAAFVRRDRHATHENSGEKHCGVY